MLCLVLRCLNRHCVQKPHLFFSHSPHGTALFKQTGEVNFIVIKDVWSEEQNIVSPGHGATFNMKHELYGLKFSAFLYFIKPKWLVRNNS